MIHRRLAVLTLTATTIAAAGCGSSSSGPLTRAELIAKADAICRRINAEVSSNPVTRTQDYARVTSLLAPDERAVSDELGRLVPPSELAADWRQIVADQRTLADGMARLREYARANNIATGEPAVLRTVVPAKQQLLAIAKRDGFKDCAEPG